MVEDQLGEFQRAFVLLQVLGVENESEGVQKSVANKEAQRNRRLGFVKAGDVNRVREALMPDYITQTRRGRAIYFEITDAGKRMLAGLRQYPEPIRVPGRAINRLLEFVGGEAPAPGGPRVGAPVNLPESIFEQMMELLRERHSQSGMVPVHEVRTEIRATHGDAAASHAEFDEAAKSLWRGKRVELVPISDLSRATQVQLDASIPGRGQTLFYMRPHR